ncbi:hypothetical protein G9P44_001498 [Scheffersomyces stipitis]|nr:hypothetical protein G9P44_001498 [Scheffersomyces stipitis]
MTNDKMIEKDLESQREVPANLSARRTITTVSTLTQLFLIVMYLTYVVLLVYCENHFETAWRHLLALSGLGRSSRALSVFRKVGRSSSYPVWMLFMVVVTFAWLLSCFYLVAAIRAGDFNFSWIPFIGDD